MAESNEPQTEAVAQADAKIDYNAPVQVRSLHGPRILLPNELNGSLPTCDCHFPEGDGAILHQGQVFLMRRGEALGEPNDEGVMCGGRVGVDVELAPESAKLYAVPKQ